MTLPQTRLSTRLSGSAQETQNRILNIFQGQRRRPPALLVLLLLCIIALCGSLVSCQNANALQGEPDVSPESSPTVSQDPTSGPALFTTDLNRNGVPETLEVIWYEDNMYYELTVTEGDQILYTAQANASHAGWNSMFLYRKDGQDFLLEYYPTMYQGVAEYTYQLFCLDEDGSPAVVQDGSVYFDLNFDSPIHQNFDPEAIAAFMDEINGLLADSTLLMNTDDQLDASFSRNDALVDDLWWLNFNFGFTRDPEQPLVETLRDYLSYQEELITPRPAVPFRPTPGMTDSEAALAAFQAVLRGEATFYLSETDRNIDVAHISEALDCGSFEFAVLDLDGDAVPEAVLRSTDYAQYSVALRWQEGTICGYQFYIRSLNSLLLKADGTFEFSSGADDWGWGKLSFSAGSVSMTELCSRSGSDFVVDGQSASQDEFNAALALQDGKADAVWYEFTDANIALAFS